MRLSRLTPRKMTLYIVTAHPRDHEVRRQVPCNVPTDLTTNPNDDQPLRRNCEAKHHLFRPVTMPRTSFCLIDMSHSLSCLLLLRLPLFFSAYSRGRKLGTPYQRVG